MEYCVLRLQAEEMFRVSGETPKESRKKTKMIRKEKKKALRQIERFDFSLLRKRKH